MTVHIDRAHHHPRVYKRLFALAIGVGFFIGCTVYLIRHRGES